MISKNMGTRTSWLPIRMGRLLGARTAAAIPEAARGTMRHRPELDGLRGIAILVVLASHSRLAGFAADGGLAGVTLFFVLSGFLITSLLANEFDGRQGARFPGFLHPARAAPAPRPWSR